MRLLSRKATCNTHGQDSSYFLGWEEYEKNPYDKVKNPNGIIQMGLAENQLSFDLLESWLAKNPDVSGFKRDGKSIFRELALFQDYHGLPLFKKALVDFMAEIRGNKVTFDPNHMVLTAGATSANETLMFCVAEEGDAFLLPTPYYPGFDRDLKWRTGVEIVPIQCTSSNNFRITESALEQAYQDATKRNLRVKGVLVTNPSNPLGTTLSRNEFDLLVDFIKDKETMHLISDEILLWHQFTVVYSLSKDLGLPGFRVGCYLLRKRRRCGWRRPRCQALDWFLHKLSIFWQPCWSDNKFTKKYISENQKRLRRRQRMLVTGLQKSGNKVPEKQCWFVLLVDMRHLLCSNTFEAEMELWKKIVYQVGLNISPGSSCHCSEPGWFRVCFANMSQDTLNVAMKRVKNFVTDSTGAECGSSSVSFTKSFSNWVFRLSSRDHRAPEER
ncbi:hypothetical protein AAHE18_15G042400 [Arachis hypogaea]